MRQPTLNKLFAVILLPLLLSGCLIVRKSTNIPVANANMQGATKGINAIQSATGIYFTHYTLGFSLLFPSGWTMEEHSTASTADFFDAVALAGPKDTELRQGMKIELTPVEKPNQDNLQTLVTVDRQQAVLEGAEVLKEETYVVDSRVMYVTMLKRIGTSIDALVRTNEGIARISGYIGPRSGTSGYEQQFITILRSFRVVPIVNSSSIQVRQPALSVVVPKGWVVRNTGDSTRDVQYESDTFSIENSSRPLFWSSGKGPDNESTVSTKGIAVRIKQIDFGAPTLYEYLNATYPLDSYKREEVAIGNGIPAVSVSAIESVQVYNQEYVMVQGGRAFVVGVRQESEKDDKSVQMILHSINIH